MYGLISFTSNRFFLLPSPFPPLALPAESPIAQLTSHAAHSRIHVFTHLRSHRHVVLNHTAALQTHVGPGATVLETGPRGLR